MESLPLIHNDDAFILTIEPDPPRSVLLHRIVRYPHNQNVDGEFTRFFDLDELARAAIVRQIQRRYAGRTVKVVINKDPNE